MRLEVRLGLYALLFATGGVVLSIFAVLIVASGNGLSRLPAPFEALVATAYWPARVSGIAPGAFFSPNLFSPIMINLIGWAVAGTLLAILHHSFAGHRNRSE
jgi:hypothetical protein